MIWLFPVRKSEAPLLAYFSWAALFIPSVILTKWSIWQQSTYRCISPRVVFWEVEEFWNSSLGFTVTASWTALLITCCWLPLCCSCHSEYMKLSSESIWGVVVLKGPMPLISLHATLSIVDKRNQGYKTCWKCKGYKRWNGKLSGIVLLCICCQERKQRRVA